jgi:adenosylhomocysteinase
MPSRSDRFFGDVIARFPPARNARIAVVTHLLPDRPAFLRALARIGRVEWVIPVRYSEAPGVAAAASELGITVRHPPGGGGWPPDPEWWAETLAETLAAAPDPLVVCEIGGYFAPVLAACAARWPDRLLGAVEDTESGHRRYAGAAPLPVPVVSIARSPLKGPEDQLVGESIAFSVERVLRALGRPMPGCAATVLGYGAVGSATAAALRSRGAHVSVWDPDPQRRILALAGGLTSPARDDALCGADLIVGCSGATSLESDDLALLRPGCVLASGSSRQSEIDIGDRERRAIIDGPIGLPLVEAVALPDGGDAYLTYAGFPANFADGAAIGPFLRLSQAEILVAISSLTARHLGPGLCEVADGDRSTLADLWLDVYGTPPEA